MSSLATATGVHPKTRVGPASSRSASRVLECILSRIHPAICICILAWAGCAQPINPTWLGLDLLPTSDGGSPALPGGADRANDFELVGELEVRTIRVPLMDWGRIQPSSNASYDFSETDEWVRLSQQAGVELLVVFPGPAGWAAGNATISPRKQLPDEQHRKAFVQFVEAFVSRYDARGGADMPGLKHPLRAYQFMENIENLPPADYARWLRLFHDTVKSVCTESQVVLGTLESPGVHSFEQPEGDYPTWFSRLLGESALQGPGYPCFDVLAFSNFPNRYPGRPPFDEALAYLRLTLEGRQLDRPIWLTAFGFDSGLKEGQRQANLLVRWAIHGRALGIERLYVHCLRDRHVPGDASTGTDFGLVEEAESGQTPQYKPAFRAIQVLLKEIQQRPRVSFRGDGVYTFTGKGEPTYAIWKSTRGDPTSFIVPGWWEIRTMTGKRSTVQGPEVKPTGTPVFVQRVQSPFIN